MVFLSQATQGNDQILVFFRSRMNMVFSFLEILGACILELTDLLLHIFEMFVKLVDQFWVLLFL